MRGGVSAGYNPPAAVTSGSQADPTNPAFDTYCSQDLEKALDSIFYHPNLGPLICRELIQRLVMSNPSAAYVYRVTQIFNDDGTAQHTRGNMKAVFKAILLDGEARNSALALSSATAAFYDALGLSIGFVSSCSKKPGLVRLALGLLLRRSTR